MKKRTSKAALVNDMKKFLALPPYNEPSNYVAHDGYFARDIEKRAIEGGYTWDQIQAEARGQQ